MEILENELEVLISKLKNADDFRSEIENIQNVYPFNRYEYIITKLVEEKILSYDDKSIDNIGFWKRKAGIFREKAGFIGNIMQRACTISDKYKGF